MVLSFRNLHSFHSNATKTQAIFWSEVHSKLMTNPALLNALAHDGKLVLLIHNANKISGPKRSIKICFTDHFTCTSANVIYCITCTYCKKIYIGETGRRPGDRFREHLRDVERNDKAHQNQSLDILIYLIILNNIWQSAAFRYIQVARKAAKLLKKSLFFKSALLIPQVLTNAFHCTNLFMLFSSLCSHQQRSSTFSM